jgi:uncharacterized membrane protein
VDEGQKSNIGPGVKLLTLGLASGVALGYLRQRRGSGLVRLIGLGLVGGAVYTGIVEGLLPFGFARRTIHLHSSIIIKRPVFDVFAFFKDFEHFPMLVGGLTSVDDFEDGRSHWRIETFAGRPLEWDSVVTKFVPGSIIAWKSVPGSPVEASGTVRFAPVKDDQTKLDIEFIYRPEKSDLLEALHALGRASRADELTVGLARVAAYLESNAPATRPSDAEASAVPETSAVEARDPPDDRG